jgi:hypothetical protein
MNGFEDSSDPEDWDVLRRLLPPGWEAAAKDLGALRRARGIPDASTLLRTLLVHLADGCSLQETAALVGQAGWCSVSAVALFKRLRASGEWLRWMAERLWRRSEPALRVAGRRLRAVDATTVQEPGSTGTDWRVHYVLDLASLACDFFEVTDARGGETFRRIPVAAGDLLLGDRVYGTPPGVAHVLGAGGSVLVRVNQKALPLRDFGGDRFPLALRVAGLGGGRLGDWPTRVVHGDTAHAGRLVARPLPGTHAQAARQRLRRRASRRQESVSAEAVRLAGYVMVWTDVPAAALSAGAALELYRQRWQIELAFKRMKSTMGLGQLPKRNEASARAWLHGKLLVALLVERLLDAAEAFSPRTRAVDAPPEPVA